MARGMKLADLAFLGRVGAGSGVTPASFPGLLRWYKADYYATLGASDGQAVGGGTNPQPVWFDETNSGDNAANVNNGPQYKVNIVGSMPVLRFDIVTGNSLGFAPGNLAGDFTFMFACARTASPGGHSILVHRGATNHNIHRALSGSNVLAFFNGTTISDTGLSGSASAFMVVTVRRSGTTVSLRQNKTGVGGGTAAGGFLVEQIGSSLFGSQMDMGEVMIWNTHLSDSNVDQLYDSYLKPRWTTLP